MIVPIAMNFLDELWLLGNITLVYPGYTVKLGKLIC